MSEGDKYLSHIHTIHKSGRERERERDAKRNKRRNSSKNTDIYYDEMNEIRIPL